MRKLQILFIFIIFSAIALNAQEFLYQASIPQVDTSGYYHIFLPPQLTSQLNHKFSDIRLYSSDSTEIPYIRLSEDEIYKTAKSSALKILQNDYKRQKKYTQLLIHNNNLLDINNLVLVVQNPQNSEAWLTITGSNDLKNWNVLKNNTRYMPEYSDSTTAQIRIDDLPESKFEYYRIFLYDYNKVVFNVKKVLNFDIAEHTINYIEIPNPSFVQDDTSESNLTIVRIFFDKPQYVDKIKFDISEPENYLRKAEIAKKDSISGKRIRLQFYDQNQKEFYLCSDSTNELLLSRYYAKNLYLVVTNNDDNPLKFSNIRVYQQKEYIVAYLEKSTDYVILYGNPNVPPPIYDLKFFKNKIPPICPVVEALDFHKIIQDNSKNKSVHIEPIYLWIIFFIVIVILALISVKMFIYSKRDTKNDDIDIL